MTTGLVIPKGTPCKHKCCGSNYTANFDFTPGNGAYRLITGRWVVFGKCLICKLRDSGAVEHLARNGITVKL